MVRNRPSPSRRASSSAILRSLMSRIAAVTRMPSGLSSGLNMISMGNSLPFFRLPASSIPVPICCDRASSVDRRASVTIRSAKPSDDFRDFLSYKFVPGVSEPLLRRTFRRTISSALVNHHHGIRSRFQKPTIARLGLCQLPFCVFAHTDIADCGGHQNTPGTIERAQHDLDGKLAAVLSPPREFEPLFRFAAPGHLPRMCGQRSTVPRIHAV